MKPSTVVSCVFALASSMLMAQNARTARPERAQLSAQTFTLSAAQGSSCPVSFHALQGTGGGLVAVRDAKPTSGPSQRIHLILSDTPSQALSAKVMVRGLSGRDQVMRTDRGGKSDATKRLAVRFFSEDDKSVAADLVLPGFTSVQSVELEAIRYEDGSIWTLGGREACRVAPDPFMLVAGR